MNNKVTPNSQQQAAIEHPPGPLMILAGAGTGKTFTLEKRIIYLIKSVLVDPSHILAITYTEKAANELKSRIVQKIGASAHEMTVNTFHSFCLKLLKEYQETPLPQLFDESEAIHLFLERFDEFQFESDEFPLNPQRTVTESFIPFFNRIRDELVDPSQMEIPELSEDGLPTEELQNQLRDLQTIYPIFQQWKKDLNVMDYGDMILSAFNMLNNHPDILKKVQNQYRHIIVDEFQDNNFALNEMLSSIAGKRQYITVVGDDDQVIYSFRGANSYNIQYFAEKYKDHPNYNYIALEQNFRSTQQILNVANQSIVNNVDRMEKVLESAQKGPSEKPVRFQGTQPEQLEFILNKISNLVIDGTFYSDIAILCRTHSKVKLVTETLQRSGIPVKPTWPGFFQIPEVRTVVAWCQVIGGSLNEDQAFYRLILQTCGYKIAHLSYANIGRRNDQSRFNIISQNSEILNETPELSQLVSDIQSFREIVKKKSAGEMVWSIVSHLGFLKESAQTYSLDHHFILLNVGDLLKRSQDFTRRNKKNHSLFAFNIYLDAMMSTRGLPSIKPPIYRELDAVLVNTVHGVKGGEFPVVFLPFQRAGSFPLNPKPKKKITSPPEEWLRYDSPSDLTEKEHHYQEERRLFYVAITRAKEKLYVLTPKTHLSKFIKELPDSLMEDHPMPQSDQPLNTHSDLKIKYEQKLQKALSREDYRAVKQWTDALTRIQAHESGETVTLGGSDWEQELQQDLSTKFQPPAAENINLSASAIEMYQQCPLKFRLGRIDGIPQTASKPELVFGTIIHTVLQRFHEPNKELTEERILRLLDEEWKNGEFDYTVREEKFKEQGAAILIRYNHFVQSDPPTVLAREESFVVDMGNITIRGAIDRIDQTEDGTVIVDYKTSKTGSSAKSNLQLAIYSMYLAQLDDDIIGGLPKESSLHFLRDEEKPIWSHSFTIDQIGKTKEKIIEVAAGIRNRDFDAKTGFHCEWCDYKNLVCPAYEGI